MELKDFNYNTIISRTKERWDSKSISEKAKQAKKYKHLFNSFNKNEWNVHFNELSLRQKSLLIKGEVIRAYNSLSYKDRKDVCDSLGIYNIASKWHMLELEDRLYILSEII